MKRSFPSTSYNPISTIGAGLALFGAASMIIMYVWDVFSHEHNPYRGILIFVVFPLVLFTGLVLIPVGMAWEKRRRQRGKSEPLVIDLGRPQHRNAVVVFVGGTCIFLLLATLGLYGSFEFSESVVFCGEVCHEVMEPEYVAYQYSPHAQVKCVTCHIGPGAGWYVKSKLDGARQVVAAIANTYSRPIPTPIEHLRPAREVCEQCHWPGKFFSSKQETWDYFLGDENNTHWRVEALMHVGGTSASGEPTGSHWHVDERNHLTYVASDHTRGAIDQVTWDRNGEVVVFTRTGEPLPDSVMAEKRAHGLERTMDCMDCHNRPAHVYRPPMRSVGTALSSGVIDSSVPWIKREAVKALSHDYATREGARDSIAIFLEAFYANAGIDLPQGTVEAVQEIYRRNAFPEMRVRWDRYPNHGNHLNFSGCFRCHGSELRTAQGETIRDDCNACHTILAQGPVDEIGTTLDLSGLQFRHPIDIDGAERIMNCTECHIGDASLYLPREADLAEE